MNFRSLIPGHLKVLERLYLADRASFEALAAVAQERLRQIEVEGLKPAGDDRLAQGSLERFSACYLCASVGFPFLFPPKPEGQKEPVELFPRQEFQDKRRFHPSIRLLEIGVATSLAALAKVYRKG